MNDWERALGYILVSEKLVQQQWDEKGDTNYVLIIPTPILLGLVSRFPWEFQGLKRPQIAEGSQV